MLCAAFSEGLPRVRCLAVKEALHLIVFCPNSGRVKSLVGH